MISAAEIGDFKGFSLRKACTFIFLFFIFFLNGYGQEPANIVPSYDWLNGKDLSIVAPRIIFNPFPSVVVNTEDIRIALDTDSANNVYILTFGHGIDKYDSEGNILNNNFISQNQLDNPLDIAIDEEGYIYVADYLASGDFFDNGKIKVFDSQGNFLPDRTILTSFYRPLGLDVDDKNVYVAEYNDGNQGPESNPLSRVRIYSKVTTLPIDQTESVNAPYRIAINSLKEVYVSQANIIDVENDEADPQVLKFNSTLDNPKILTDVTSPGSIVIDAFDYIHIIEYRNRINFQKFINYENLGTSETLNLYSEIDEGIDNNEFQIKIFDSNDNLLKTLTDDDSNFLNIEFPVDIAFNNCDKMYTINANTVGTASIDFDLEIYARTPAFDSEAPIFSFCPNNINATAQEGNNYAVVTFLDATASDANNFTITQTGGPNSGSQFPVGETLVEYTATDICGNENTCSFVVTVEASEEEPELQILNCPEDQIIEVDTNCSYATPDIAATIATNIEGAVVTQSITPGFQINGSMMLTITAKFEDQIDTCEVQLIANDSIDPIISCPEDQIVAPDENGEFMLPNYILQAEYDDNCFIAKTEQFPEVGTKINSNTEIELMVTDGSGNQTSCFFQINFEESPEPPFTCKNSISFTLEEDGAKTIFPEELLNVSGDISDYEFSLSKNNFDCSDVNGENETGRVPVTITYTGPVNGSCTVMVDINDEDAPVFVENCENVIKNLPSGQNEASVEFEVPTVSDNCSVTVEQTGGPSSGSTFSIGETGIEFTATDPTGNETVCKFLIIIREDAYIPPTVQDDEYSMQENSVLTVAAPGVLANDSDPDGDSLRAFLQEGPFNGSITLEEDGSFIYTPNTDFTGVDSFVYYATDGEGEAEATVRITVNETSEFALNCPQNESVIKADENCEYIVPDFSTLIDYSPSNATFVQSIPIGSKIDQETNITVTASFEGETDSCTFRLILKDNTPPVVSCPADKTVFIAEDDTYLLPDFRNELELSDNCGLGEVIQEPAANTPINGDTQVDFLIFDAAGNASTCSFNLLVEVDEPGNQAPVSVSESYITFINTTLNISATEGVLANDIDPEGGEITAVLANDVLNGTLQLNSDGSFTYTPNSGFTGEDRFTYYVNDGELNSETVRVDINVLAKEEGFDFECLSTINKILDENGEVEIQIEELYSGDATGVTFSLSKSEFSCGDLGANTLRLSYTKEGEEDFCDIVIVVEDITPPVFRLNDISIELNTQGTATISIEDIDNGSFDNCDDNVNYTLSKTAFSCKEVGTNQVQVLAEDSSGNISTETITVTVNAENDVCEDPPLEGSEYVFIYPNPNTGSFKIATPADVTISRIEVFDHRGRFIAAKDYDTGTFEYGIDLGPLQEAVYVVKIQTNEGILTKRFIFKY